IPKFDDRFVYHESLILVICNNERTVFLLCKPTNLERPAFFIVDLEAQLGFAKAQLFAHIRVHLFDAPWRIPYNLNIVAYDPVYYDDIDIYIVSRSTVN